MPTKVKEAIKFVEGEGWRLVGTKGSHRQFKHSERAGRVTIAGKPSDTLPPGTWSNIRKQAKGAT